MVKKIIYELLFFWIENLSNNSFVIGSDDLSFYIWFTKDVKFVA